LTVYYLDTSILLAYTLMRHKEPEKNQATAELFKLINSGVIKALTSFYALHELLVIAISNTAPDLEAGSELAREALRSILDTTILYVPLPTREDRILQSRRFAALPDSTDVPHAVAAYVAGCHTIIAYDEHFRAIDHILNYKTPEEVVAEFEKVEE